MLELYGMGGKGYGTNLPDTASGGSSCQHYDSITLTKEDIQQIIIGDSTHAATKFGIYSVNNAGDATYGVGGQGTGNRGKNGAVGSFSNNFGTGELSEKYGWGAGTAKDAGGGPGAVYLKYLGD